MKERTHAYSRVADDRDAYDDRDHDAIAPGRLARTAALDGPVAPHASGLVQRVPTSGGAPLPTGLLRKFEASLGADLSGVRVHTGAESQGAARALGAKAYALGSDIHFGAGNYDPESADGEHLLAHEVAHTVFHTDGPHLKSETGSPGDANEAQADHAADAMTQDLSPVRQKLLELMKEYDGAIVGDDKFQAVIHESEYLKLKVGEAALQTLNVAKDSVGMSTTPVAKYTSCLSTQGALLRQAFDSLHLKVKKGDIAGADLSALAHRHDSSMHVQQPNDASRPRPGDMIILSPRGGGVNTADQGVQYAKGQQADAKKNDDRADKVLADAKAASDAAKLALDGVADAERSGLDAAKKKIAYDKAQTAVSFATQQAARTAKALQAADTLVDGQQGKLDKARTDDQAFRDKYGDKAFQFQHVCFLQAPVAVRDDKKEEWAVFGGGQKVARGGTMHEGSASSKAIYDPATNELGDADNRSGPNWVYGWVNPDELVDPGAKK